MRKWNSSSRTSTPLATLTLPDRAPTRYVVLDKDVASRVIKRQLGDPLAARMTGATWCVTFVTVGELWQWATMRSWGPPAPEDLGHWLDRVGGLDSEEQHSRTAVLMRPA